jgi:hypothetical protein
MKKVIMVNTTTEEVRIIPDNLARLYLEMKIAEIVNEEEVLTEEKIIM